MNLLEITMFNGWMIPDDERARLLALFPPAFSNIRVSHITLSLDVHEIPVDAHCEIVGHASDISLECMIVRVNGSIYRPDGKIYHITWSFDDTRSSKESNDVIEQNGWQAFGNAIPIKSKGFCSNGDSYITTPFSENN